MFFTLWDYFDVVICVVTLKDLYYFQFLKLL